ncbi:MAG: D-alanine--D-alanine ligase [Parcubacteria group bacterium]|nr:D-alanine--D-alanine ligase [Parcubacteria group bacterium]
MQTVVGVLRGGPSREHEVSLKTGAAILANLPEDKYLARDIYIDKQGQWHDRGRATTPDKILRQIDVAFLGLHGEYGEDGEVQKLLERFGVPYTGSDSFGSYLAMHKIMSKHKAEEVGLLTPKFHYIERASDAEAIAREVVQHFRQPVVVKPVAWGSSVGVSIVGGYAPVLAAIQHLFNEGSPTVVVEEFIKGQEATAGVVEGLRGEQLYTLPPIEIIPPTGDFFSYNSKYSGETREICPGNFTRVESEELQRLSKVMHRALGLRHYSRSDFIVTPKGIYYLETNTLPGLTAESLLPKSLASVGVAFPDFLAHLIGLART